MHTEVSVKTILQNATVTWHLDCNRKQVDCLCIAFCFAMLTCSVSQQDLAKPAAGNVTCSLFTLVSVHASVQLQRLDTLTTL